MAKPTIAQLQAALAASEAGRLGLEQQLQALKVRINHDFVSREEYNRVQGVLRSTQLFLKKYKDEARGAPAPREDAPVSERRAQMEAAKRAATESGQSVAVTF